MKAVKIASILVAAVVVLLALVAAVGIPSGFINSAIQSRIERDTGYRLAIAGASSVKLWPSLRVTLNEVTLEDPKDRTGIRRVTVDNLQADVSLESMWSSHAHVSEIIVTRPVFYLPLLRERLPATDAPRLDAAMAVGAVHIDRVKIKDGTLAFSTTRDRVESRLEAVNAEAVVVGGDRKVDFTGTARAGEQAIKFNITATTPIEHQSMPAEFTIEMPGALQQPVSGKASVRLNGAVVMINDIGGTFGSDAFNGWASIDIASKPLVKLDLDFQRLNIPLAKSADNPAAAQWSDAPISVSWLNYVDAQMRISATEANIGESHFAPVVVDAQLADGLLKAGVSKLGADGGQVSGNVMLDATSGSPSFVVSADLIGVRARPLLTSLASFDEIDGKLQAKLALRSVGASQRALMSNLAGTVFANLQDGAIRSINIPRLIRSLTSGTLSGWQESNELSTDLTQLSASFRIDKGRAVTTDLTLIGPLVKVTGAGTIDLGARTMAFRVEPKLVLTTEGQGRAGDPVGFGIPVMIDGSWAAPRIYPDMAGMLDNPDAAYAKLREMGKGLFGPDGAGVDDILGGSLGSGSLGETIGNLLKQGLRDGSASQQRSLPATPNDTAPQAAPPPPKAQDSQPMNDLLRQLFNR